MAKESKAAGESAPQVDPPAQTEPITTESPIKRPVGFAREQDLSDEEVIQRRTAGDFPPDGKYYRVFNIAAPVVSVGVPPELDWSDDQHEAMHEANKLAVLQDALNRGLHPQGPARFDGARSADGALVYSVPVIPAADDERAAATYTPSKALADQGGTTAPDAG